MKRAAKIITFVMLFGAAYWYVDRVFENKEGTGIELTQYRKFYRLKKNTLDVLILGSSMAYVNINPAIIWQEKGILSYHLSTSVQRPWTSYYNLIECLKYQKPRLVVLEVSTSIEGSEYLDLARVYSCTSALRLSINKINSVKAAVPTDNLMNILLGFPICHSRRDLTRNDFVDPYKDRVYPNGYFSFTHTQAFDRPEFEVTEDTLPLPDKQRAFFIKILDLLKEKNIPLLLYASPRPINSRDIKLYNTIAGIALEYGVCFINYNLRYDEINFNFQEDMADVSHLNTKSAAKLSRHLADIFAENYGLPDHRRDPTYAEWNDWADRVMAEINPN
jgi:hypothetical protein